MDEDLRLFMELHQGENTEKKEGTVQKAYPACTCIIHDRIKVGASSNRRPFGKEPEYRNSRSSVEGKLLSYSVKRRTKFTMTAALGSVQ